MRILYYSHSFGSPTTTFIRNETEYFNKTEQVKYLCAGLYKGAANPGYADVIPFEEKTFAKKLRWWRWQMDVPCSFKNAQYAKKLNNYIEAFKPDVIHCHFAYEALMLLDNIKEIGKYPIVVHFHGYDATAMTKKKSYVRKLKKYLALKNVFTVSCNDFFLDKLKKGLHIPISQSAVIHYGIDAANMFMPVPARANPLVIMQVSSLQEKKGHEFTLRAFKKLIGDKEYSQVKLYLTGDGPRKAMLQKMATELQLDDNVKFLGTLGPKDISTRLNEASVFVHHSITAADGDMEGIPNAIIEAMAMELPVVSTYHSGIPELVEDGVNGYLVKEKDIDAYTEAIKKALKMGRLKVNRDKILSEYNIELHNQRIKEVYLTCISHTKQGA